MPTNDLPRNPFQEDDDAGLPGQNDPANPADASFQPSENDSSGMPKESPFVDTGALNELIAREAEWLNPTKPTPPPSANSTMATKRLDMEPELLDPPKPPAPRPGPTRPLDMEFEDRPIFQPAPDETPASRFFLDSGAAPETPPERPQPAPQRPPMRPRPPTSGLTPRPPAGSTTPEAKKPTGSTSPLNRLAQKLETRPGTPAPRTARKLLPGRFEKDKQLGYSDDMNQPFVGDDDEYDTGADQSLATKIRRGSVSPETLRLLITASLTEAEVLAICSDLNVDWTLVPGETREEKTQYLIEYFENNGTHLDYKEVAATVVESSPFSTDTSNWDDSDDRLKELQENLTSGQTESAPVLAAGAEKLPFFQQLAEDFTQASPLQKVLVVGLSIILFSLLVVIGFIAFRPRLIASAPPAPRNTPLPIMVPSPRSMQLPGGWIFPLKPGVVQDGLWLPTGPEWLQGTEICRLVSLPWNRQLDAVYTSLQVGDELFLTMTNEELLIYTITELKSVDLQDFDSDDLHNVIQGTSPCLAIILTNGSTETRQVIMSVPASNLRITVTPEITQTLNPAFPTVTLPPTQTPAVTPTPAATTLTPTKSP